MMDSSMGVLCALKDPTGYGVEDRWRVQGDCREAGHETVAVVQEKNVGSLDTSCGCRDGAKPAGLGNELTGENRKGNPRMIFWV